MKVSFNWIKQYVNLPDSISAEEVAEKLKLATVEVEGVEKQGEALNNIVVGKVEKAEKHPQADKLKLCLVNAGNEKLQVVCGGSNVAEGMLVAFAKVGSKVRWHGEGDLLELKPAVIRGVESFGMICGASELDLATIFPPKDEREIIDLTAIVTDKFIGKPLAEALKLNDVIFEIDNKSLSHRPDLWGHYGLARETAALFDKTLKNLQTKKIKEGKEMPFTVDIKDPDLCPRYMAVAVSGIEIGESPAWMKQRLTAVGLRPINNIVDITNYIMLDLGEPMHAFDASRLSGNKSEGLNSEIIVRRAEEGEAFTLLDGNKIELTTDDLIIADSEKALALAGVMGGEFSGVNKNTTTVIFEAANFNASAIRKSSLRHGQRTDSSSRFEKSLDPSLCEIALNRAVELTMEFCPNAKVVSRLVDKGNYVLKTGPVIFEKDIFSKKLGIAISEKNILKIFDKLGFKVADKGDSYSIIIPSWRATKDISIAEDLVEEVLRIYGYDKVESFLPAFPIVPPVILPVKELEIKLRGLMSRNLAYDEVYNYSFISRDQVDKMGDKHEYLELDNPLSKEKPFMRRSLVPNLVENAVKNIEYFDRVAIYEIGKVFWGDAVGLRTDLNGGDLLPRQDTWFAGLYTEKKNENPLIEARRVVEAIDREFNLNLSIVNFKKPEAWHHPARVGEITAHDICLGYIYELEPAVASSFGADFRIGIVEINVNLLLEALQSSLPIKYERPSAYPEVERDVAFVVDQNIEHATIINALKKADNLLMKIELFDVFSNEKIGVDKKSMAYRLTFCNPERTLNSEEIDDAMIKVRDILADKFGAEVRA